MAALETMVDAQPKHELPVAGSDAAPNKIQQGATTPTVGDVNAAGAQSQAAAQGTVDNHFGSVTLSDREMAFCKQTYSAPRDSQSQRPNSATGLNDHFMWKDGFGIGVTTDKQGHAESCSLSPTGTIAYMKGEFNPRPKPDETIIKPNDIEIVSNGGKLEYTPGPNGTVLQRSNDPSGTREQELIPADMKTIGYIATRGNMQVYWGKPQVDQKGVPHTNFATSSNFDNAERQNQLKQWKKENGLPQ